MLGVEALASSSKRTLAPSRVMKVLMRSVPLRGFASSDRRVSPDCAASRCCRARIGKSVPNYTVPVKRHRGEPGHTRTRDRHGTHGTGTRCCCCESGPRLPCVSRLPPVSLNRYGPKRGIFCVLEPYKRMPTCGLPAGIPRAVGRAPSLPLEYPFQRRPSRVNPTVKREKRGRTHLSYEDRPPLTGADTGPITK